MKTDIESKMNEAEVCRSMGLYNDALDIYESIQLIADPEDTQIQDKIQKQISLLQNEITDQKEAQPTDMDIKGSLISEIVSSGNGDVPEILNSAAAFQEMGLHTEALTQYGRLFEEDYPTEKVIPLVTESLLKLHSPAKAVKAFNKLVNGE